MVHLSSLMCLEWLAGSLILFFTPPGCSVGFIRKQSGSRCFSSNKSWFSFCFGLKCAPLKWMPQKPDTTSRGLWKPYKSTAHFVLVGGFHTSTWPCVRWALSCWAALTIFLWCPSRFTPRFWTSLKERADEPNLVQHFGLLCALTDIMKDSAGESP